MTAAGCPSTSLTLSSPRCRSASLCLSMLRHVIWHLVLFKNNPWSGHTLSKWSITFLTSEMEEIRLPSSMYQDDHSVWNCVAIWRTTGLIATENRRGQGVALLYPLLGSNREVSLHKQRRFLLQYVNSTHGDSLGLVLRSSCNIFDLFTECNAFLKSSCTKHISPSEKSGCRRSTGYFSG